MKIRPVEVELFRADRRTDMTKPVVAFRNFANAPQNADWDWPTRYNARVAVIVTLKHLFLSSSI